MAQTCLVLKLSLLPFQSASEYQNNKTIPCPTLLTPAPSIPTIRALTSLNLSNNNLGTESAKHVAAVLTQCK